MCKKKQISRNNPDRNNKSKNKEQAYINEATEVHARIRKRGRSRRKVAATQKNELHCWRPNPKP